MQIRPNSTFPIVYVISDPSDSNTYYVRSVIRNSATGAIIRISNLNYVNLTVDSGNSRRFSKSILAPADSSGAGFFIDVTTTVYTDSGYTVKSDAYQEDNAKYLVLEPWSPALGTGGGGWTGKSEGSSVGIDYEKLKEIIKEAFTELPTTELPNLDLSSLINDNIEIRLMMRDLKKSLKVDEELLCTILSKKVVESIKFPESTPIDFSQVLDPILEKFDGMTFPDVVSPAEYRDHIDEIRKDLTEVKTNISHNGKKDKIIQILKKELKGFDTEDYGDRVNNLMS